MKTTNPLIFAVAMLAAANLGHAQTAFTKITTGPVVSDAASSGGVKWVDFDGDGDLDLFVSNYTGENLFYRNDGGGVFIKIDTVLDTGSGYFGASWVDFDNDGRLDFFLGGQPTLLFHQEAHGAFTKSTVTAEFAHGGVWGDYDKDGFVDLLIAQDGHNTLWRNNGHSGFSPVTTSLDASGDGLTWVDYDNDGDLDVFVAEGPFSGGGVSRLYRNDGGGKFTKVTGGELGTKATFCAGAAWGDCDNDGFPDLFVARENSGQSLPSFLFHNNTNGTFTQVAQLPFTSDTGRADGASWGDYDNDGWLDLFVSVTDGSKNRVYHNNGDGTFTRVLTGPIAQDNGIGNGSGWGDYDRDGFLDLFVATAAGSNPQPNDYLYHNDGNSNAWIIVKCVGTRSNRSAIGAKVRVKATIGDKTFWQLREINTGNIWDGNPLEAHFGLGNATNVETLRIEWPSDAVQEFQNVPSKQSLTVTEPSRLVTVLSGGTPQFILQGGRNMQYDIQTATNLTNWALLTTLTITNLNGTAQITDTTVQPLEARFYRAVSH